MSVRRLAEDTIQPDSFSFSKENTAWAKERIALYPEGRQASAVIPLLMRAQEQEGWVTRAVIEEVARMLDMPYIRVLEVATFYTQFQLEPVGTKAHIQVCGTTPCMLRGAEDIRAVCQRKIHQDPHQTNADGTLSWEEVECLGACVNAPMVAIGKDTYEDLTAGRMEEIIDAFANDKADTIKPGTQIDRTFSAPQSGQTTLTEVPRKSDSRPAKGRPADDEAPTTPGKKRDIPLESAPAVEGPDDDAKVSESAAESEREEADKAAGADGTPNEAGRPGAHGAEAGGGKRGKGRSVHHSTDAQPIFDPPEGEADDLTLISGVGPVLARKLHAAGVSRFDQIARFKKADIRKLDEALSFKGRVERDQWVKQAKALAKGEAEYVRVFGKKPR